MNMARLLGSGRVGSVMRMIMLLTMIIVVMLVFTVVMIVVVMRRVLGRILGRRTQRHRLPSVRGHQPIDAALKLFGFQVANRARRLGMSPNGLGMSPSRL